MTPSIHLDDRAVSVTVTHVLTIAITTILIAGLLTAATGLLDSEQNRAGNREMRSVGETLATEIVTLSESAQNRQADTATLRTNYPSRVVGDTYKVRWKDTTGSECASRSIYEACLILTTGNQLTVEVPVNLPGNVEAPSGDGNFISGGEIVIEYTNSSPPEVTIREA